MGWWGRGAGALALGVLLAACGTMRGTTVPGPAPTQEGVASWYGPGFHGKRTANGEIYDQHDLTAAHPSLPLGTRVMVTKESPLHENYKKLAQEKQVYDTIFSKRFDGILCRVMKTDAAERAVKRGLSWPAAYYNSRDFAKMVKMPHSKLVIGILLSGYSSAKQLAYMANAFKAIRVATEDGDSKTGVLPAGQVQGLIHDQPTVAELFERMEKEAQNAQYRVAAALS